MDKKSYDYAAKKVSLPVLRRKRSGTFTYYGLTVEWPLEVPAEYTREVNLRIDGKPVPIPKDETFSYENDGFCCHAEKMAFIAFRTGVLAALRAKKLEQILGVMISAPNSPEEYNGLKIVEPTGDMLRMDWEEYATKFIEESDDFPFVVACFCLSFDISKDEVKNAGVVCAMDTRDGGSHLMKAVQAGVKTANVMFVDLGILTTPQLHYITRCKNFPQFGRADYFGYNKSLARAFEELYNLIEEPEESTYSKKLILDCTNNGLFQKFRTLMDFLDDYSLKVEFRYENGLLNYERESDFVKSAKVLPAAISSMCDKKFASIDEGAERLIYFYPNGKRIEILDGNKTAILFAMFIQDQLQESNLKLELTLGIVQTSWANAASTKCIEECLHMKVITVPNGKRHLLNAARVFDIGVYFAADGYGTVYFSQKFYELIGDKASSNESIRRLQLFSRVINQTVGDGFANLLAVELVLRYYGWSIDDWAQTLYKDVPNVQTKMLVEDVSVFKVDWKHSELLKPTNLHARIKEHAAKFRNSRAFVRPLYLENSVEIYVEADSFRNAEKLTDDIKKIIKGVFVGADKTESRFAGMPSFCSLF